MSTKPPAATAEVSVTARTTVSSVTPFVLYSLAAQIESAASWADRRPPMAAQT